MTGISKAGNEYARLLGDDFDRIPKSVLAAVAVSFASAGGDHLGIAREAILDEWRILNENGIVPQKPRRTR